jgi:hypothetical protein
VLVLANAFFVAAEFALVLAHAGDGTAGGRTDAGLLPGDTAARRPLQRPGQPRAASVRHTSLGLVTLQDLLEELVGEIEEEAVPAGSYPSMP